MRYKTLSSYYKSVYKEKVRKIAVDAGFTCPNRDGLKGFGGCIYCNVDSFVHVEQGDIKRQVESKIEKFRKKGFNKFSVYFQSFSNTYGDTGKILGCISESLVDESIVEIAIGTRPDVLEDEKLIAIKEKFGNYDIIFELGLQSIHNETLKLINRGHTFEEFDRTFDRVKSYGFKVCVHLIFGLPFESEEMMIETAKYVSDKSPDLIKFHHLHVVKDTKLAEMYLDGKIKLLSEKEYIEILAKSIALLDESVIISRVVGDSPKEMTLSPEWPESKTLFLKRLDEYLKYKDICQGCKKI